MIKKQKAIVILILIILSLFPLKVITYTHDGEDIFITLRYVENLVNGNGFVYNIGERVEGYSNFLWAIILAIPAYFGYDLINSAKLLSILFYTLTIILSFIYMTNKNEDKISYLSLFAPLLLLTNPMLQFQVDIGLETHLYIFLMFLSAYYYIKREFILSSIAFSLVAMTRPEGFAYFMIFCLYCIIETRLYDLEYINKKKLKTFSTFIIPFILTFGPYLAWRIWYYGYPLPNTVYVKFATESFIKNHSIGDLWQFVVSWSFIPFLIIPIFYYLFKKEFKEKRTIKILLLYIFSIALYTIYIGKVFTSAFRHYSPMIPFIVMIVSILLKTINDSLSMKKRRIILVLFLIILGLNIYTINNKDATPSRFHCRIIQFIKNRDFNERLNWFFEPPIMHFAETGRWINKNLPANALYACDQMGQLGYYSQRHIIDLIGLMDETIAHKGFSVDYILSRNPDYAILLGYNDKAYLDHLYKMENDVKFKDRYEKIYRILPNVKYDESEFIIYGNKKTVDFKQFEGKELPLKVKIGLPTDEFEKRWRVL